MAAFKVIRLSLPDSFDQAHAHKSSLSAVDLSYPPFETMDEIGKPTGISVRIAQALADFSAAFEALADIAGSQLRHCGAIGHQESADECLRPGCGGDLLAKIL